MVTPTVLLNPEGKGLKQATPAAMPEMIDILAL